MHKYSYIYIYIYITYQHPADPAFSRCCMAMKRALVRIITYTNTYIHTYITQVKHSPSVTRRLHDWMSV